jgi:hypothetical protein
MRLDFSKFTPVLACMAFLAAAGGGPALAAESAVSCQLPEMKTAERPHAGDAATKVAVGISLVDITEIDDVKQNFTTDFLLFASWKDPRLKGLDGCHFDLKQVWAPKLDFVNSGRVFPGAPDRATVWPEGAVRYAQRYRGTLSFPHRLDEFPFDEHVIRISMVPLGNVLQDVELTVDAENTQRQPKLTIPDWTLGSAAGRIDSLITPGLDRTLSQFHFEISAHRRPEYYIWKVLMPLILIVAMSWSVFWINPAQFGPQIGMSATSMLTLIAFQFAMAGILPRLSYFTELDAFITASTGLVFLALLESLTTSYLVSVERKELALRMDRICRWAFPLAFIGVMIGIFVL